MNERRVRGRSNHGSGRSNLNRGVTDGDRDLVGKSEHNVLPNAVLVTAHAVDAGPCGSTATMIAR